MGTSYDKLFLRNTIVSAVAGCFERSDNGQTMSRTSPLRILWPLIAAVAVIAGGIFGVVNWQSDDDSLDAPVEHAGLEAGDKHVPSAPVPESRFLNTGENVSYVGSDQCVDCHRDEAEGYRRTGMGQSLAKLDPTSEPPDGVVEHDASSRRYVVHRQNGEMWHQELLTATVADDAVTLADHPIDWVIGSGRHSRSYLLEIDGFLVESPVTWYSKRQAWGMSPGYDHPQQEGFARAVDEGCLYCHAGRAEAVDGSTHRMQIHETWIGCERCHGPGSLHVATHDEAIQETDGDIDLTIVNQRHLERDLSESICAQCHLRSAATVIGRGRRRGDFRPGLPLSAFRADYRLIGDIENEMTVVGHVDQLRQSRCWQESQLTCTTCHNPHALPKNRVQDDYYRAVCLQCHNDQSCRVASQVREERSPDNNCVECHMPGTETEIPHLAFTHHRIGLHPDGPRPRHDSTGPGKLEPISDLTAWSDLDQQRMLGMALLEFAGSQRGQQHAESYRRHALELLSEVWTQGLRDSETASALTALTAPTGDSRRGLFAAAVVKNSERSPEAHVNALLAMALMHADNGDFPQAEKLMQDVVARRRVAGDWELLAEFQNQSGNESAGIESLEQSLAIHPMNQELRRWLVDYYARQGNHQRSNWHRDRLRTPGH